MSSAKTSEQKPSSRNQLIGAVQNVFLTKSGLTMVGFTWKAAIVATLVGAAIQNEKGTAESHSFKETLLSALFSYVILVAIVLLMNKFLKREQMSLTISKSRAEMLDIVSKGLIMIPAWGFKDVVAACMGGQPWWSGLVVLFSSVFLAVVLEPSPPLAGEQATTLDDLRKTLSSCMAMGVGFAMHSMVQAIFHLNGFDFHTIPSTCCYALGATLVASAVQGAAIHWQPENQHAKTFENFVSLSFNFLTAWAWDAFLDTVKKHVLAAHADSCVERFGIHFAWLLLVIAGCLTVILLLAIHPASRVQRVHELELSMKCLMTVVCAMLVAFNFMDMFVDGIYSCIHIAPAWQLLGVWVFAILVSGLALGLLRYGSAALESLKT